jgi:hypothetical protein
MIIGGGKTLAIGRQSKFPVLILDVDWNSLLGEYEWRKIFLLVPLFFLECFHLVNTMEISI